MKIDLTKAEGNAVLDALERWATHIDVEWRPSDIGGGAPVQSAKSINAKRRARREVATLVSAKIIEARRAASGT